MPLHIKILVLPHNSHSTQGIAFLITKDKNSDHTDLYESIEYKFLLHCANFDDEAEYFGAGDKARGVIPY